MLTLTQTQIQILYYKLFRPKLTLISNVTYRQPPVTAKNHLTQVGIDYNLDCTTANPNHPFPCTPVYLLITQEEQKLVQMEGVHQHNEMVIKNEIHKNVVGGSSMIGFPIVIAVSERDMPGIKPGPQTGTPSL